MRINKTKSKINEHYSIIKDITLNGKRTICVYENIGNFDSLKASTGDETIREKSLKKICKQTKT